MNKNLHRIIFNAARGIRMVVQETARSAGMTPGRNAALGVALAALIGPAAAPAQIIGAPNVPGGQRPTILAAPNGVPLVDIQTPSAAGVSRNVYSRFDVQSNGAILNNSRTSVQTQLGGYVQGNPWLAKGPARTILNEIDSGSPSQLRGYIEVAGQRAEVIIANPAGILVDGAGIINASRATLTTGVPQINAAGGLDGLRVSGGNINIEGKGLDLSGTDYAAIYARALQVNAGIWASDLKVITGANQIGVDDSAVSSITGSGPAPAFTLDVAVLGGMYANKIVLVGSEAGLGVRNAGNVGAGAGGLVVTAAGRLENTGTLEGARIELASASDIDNRGGTIRQTGTAGLALAAPMLSNTQGGVIGAEPLSTGGSNGASGSESGSTAGGNTPEAGNAGGGPTGDGGTSTNGGLAPTVEPPAPGSLTASGAILNDGGRIHAGGPITLQAPRINNAEGSISVAYLRVSGPTFNNAGGTLNISRGFEANVGEFDNSRGTLNAGSVDIATTRDMVNIDGKIVSAGDVSLNVGGQFDNTRGSVSAPGALTATIAGAFNNTAGTLVANGDLQLSANSINNIDGGIRSAQSAVRVMTTGPLTNSGAISAATDLSVQAASLSTSGMLRAGNSASVDVSGALVNDGSITAAGNTTISAAALTSGHTSVLGAGVQADGTLGAAGDLHVTTAAALSANGTNVAARTAVLQGASIDLASSNTSAKDIALTATGGDIVADGAEVFTPGTLAVTANAQAGQTLRNQNGRLNAARLDLSVSSLANTQGGEIIQTGTGAARIAVTGTLDNSGGTIASNGAITVAAGAVVNEGGKLFATEEAGLDLTVAGVLNNKSGFIGAGTHADIQAASLNNDAGTIASAGSLGATVSGALVNTKGGTIAGNADVALKAASIDNGSGTISARRDLRITESTEAQSGLRIVNADGKILADHDLHIVTSGDIENAGELGAGNDLRIAANSIHNAAEGVIQGKTTALSATGTVTNRGVIDGETTRIDAATIRNIGTGRIYGDQLSIGGGSLVNESEAIDGMTSAGTIAGRKRLDIGTASLDNRDGALILSGGNLFIGGALDAQGHAIGSMGTLNNHAATIESIDDMKIAADVLNNSNAGVTYRIENQPASASVKEYSMFGDDTHYDKSELAFIYLSLGGLWPTFGAQDDVLPPGSYTATSNAYGIVVPSDRYPLSRFAHYYKNPPLNSATLTAERPTSIDQTETVVQYGAWYAADDPIWSVFGVAPPPFELPADHPGKLRQDMTAQEEAQWQTYLEAHRNLDAATRTFLDDVLSRFNIAYTVYEYTTGGTKPVLDTSAPGRIVAGGSMNLAVGSGTNNMSQILAGRDLTGTGDNIRNINLEIDGTAIRRGTMITSTPAPDGRVFNEGDYGQVVPVTVTLAAARKQGNLGDVGTGAGAGNRAPGQSAADVDAASAGAPVNPIIQVQSSADPSLATRTSLPGLTMPTASLFRTVPGGRYLIETDPRFANYRNWLSSDYLLNNLGLDPNNTLKRLGDGFYEQKLIREQIAQLTGYRYLDGYTSDEAQYAALMDAGVTFAQQYHLTPGIALTDAQMAQLTSDIVWLVEQTVQLPNGSTQRVLVPQVYVRVKPGDIDGSGALLSADRVKLDMQGDVTTSGTIAGRKAVSITAENIGVLNGRVSGDKVGLEARTDIDLIGGTVDAGSVAILDAGRDLNVRSTTSSGSTSSARPGAISQGSATIIDRVAGIYVSNPGGVLAASAGNDVNLVAARIVNAGEGGQTEISAARNINLGTVTTGSANSAVFGPGNAHAEASTQEVGTRILANGNIGLYAKNDINARAATVNSAQGDVTLAAVHNVNIEAGQSTSSATERYHRQDSGTFESQTVDIERQVDRTQAIASEIGGRTVTLVAGNDIGVKGSNVVSDKGTTLVAGHNISIESVTETTSRSGSNEIRRSGVFSSGAALTFGKQEQQTISRTSSTSAAGSTVGSIAGNVNIVAGNRYSQVGSDVVAPGGDVNILAKDVRITEARETSQTHTEQRSKQSGISVGVSSPLLDAVTAARDLGEASGQTDNSRMKALGVAAGAGTVYNGMGAQAGANKKAAEAGSSSPMAGKFTVTAGSSRSESTSDQATNTAKGSSVYAGGDVNIMALGGGADSNILIQGSNVNAGHNVNLAADNKIELLAAQNTTSHNSSSSSSGWSAGVGFASGSQNGMTFEVGANTGKGSSEGSGTYWTNTHINAGNQVNMISGGDTILRGAVVSADQVNALVGGNLTIQSLQDTSVNSAKQSGGGFSASVCTPPFCYGESTASANAYNTHANGNYASVTEQSGIKAGDGGFNVHVAGNTNLVGGVIESTQAAVDAAKNSFSTDTLTISDIANFDVQKGGGWSGSVSTDGNKPNGSSAGLSDLNEHQESVTHSGISGIAGDESVRTGDNGSVGALANRWNEQQVMNDLGAQQQITAAFSSSAATLWGDYANKQEAAAQTDEDKACWSASGACRAAGHMVIGGLAGGVDGMLGAGAATQLAGTIDQAVTNTGLTGAAHDAVVAGLTTAVGGALGGSAGAAGAYNEVTNNYLSSQQVRELMDQLRDAKNREDRDKILKDYADLSARQSAAAKGCSSQCDVIAEDARAGKQALDSYANELKNLAGDSSAAGQILGTQKNDSQFFFGLGNGWIDSYGNPIDISRQMREGGKEMADSLSKGATYAAAGCLSIVICAPAAPGLVTAGNAAGALGNFLFTLNPIAYFSDWGVDAVVESVGRRFGVPLWASTPFAERIKDLGPFVDWKNGKEIKEK